MDSHDSWWTLWDHEWRSVASFQICGYFYPEQIGTWSNLTIWYVWIGCLNHLHGEWWDCWVESLRSSNRVGFVLFLCGSRVSLLDHGVEKFLEMEKGITAKPNPLFRVFFSKKNYGKVGIQSQPCWIYQRVGYVGWTSTPISGIKTRDWMIESRFSPEVPTTNSLISHYFPDMSGMANNLLMVHEDDLVPSWAEFHQELFQELVPRQQHWHLDFLLHTNPFNI